MQKITENIDTTCVTLLDLLYSAISIHSHSRATPNRCGNRPAYGDDDDKIFTNRTLNLYFPFFLQKLFP